MRTGSLRCKPDAHRCVTRRLVVREQSPKPGFTGQRLPSSRVASPCFTSADPTDVSDIYATEASVFTDRFRCLFLIEYVLRFTAGVSAGARTEALPRTSSTCAAFVSACAM